MKGWLGSLNVVAREILLLLLLHPPLLAGELGFPGFYPQFCKKLKLRTEGVLLYRGQPNISYQRGHAYERVLFAFIEIDRNRTVTRR